MAGYNIGIDLGTSTVTAFVSGRVREKAMTPALNLLHSMTESSIPSLTVLLQKNIKQN